MLELLAPAKDLECGLAAINCGADAVYIGADQFSARANAHNSLKDVKTLIDYAHRYRAKVYIALNTIFTDEEILEAQKKIFQFYEIGADAVIIQDMGILELPLPPIPLFASTQTHNNTINQVQFLEKVGFQRVILARELSLEQIKEIRKNTTVALESFVHGALCVSYSGRCYLSYAIGNRSGNRGVCAQPCRKCYSLVNQEGKTIAQNKYLLSQKDLNLSEHLEELIEAGVTSFKIEGRLKDSLYVKTVVSYYRKRIDPLLENKSLKRSSIGKSVVPFEADPHKVFNRGFCDYFLHNRTKLSAAFDSPKTIGEKIGKIQSIQQDYFSLDTHHDLVNGDGICYFNKNHQLLGAYINKIGDGMISIKNPYNPSCSSPPIGTVIYRNADHVYQKKLKNALVTRKIALSLTFTEKDDLLVLQGLDEEGLQEEVSIQKPSALANNEALAIDVMNRQFSKLGSSIFYLLDLKVLLKTFYFIPIQQLNDMRRDLVEKLLMKREKTYKQQAFAIIPNSIPYFEKKISYEHNVLNKHAYNFYIRHGVDEVQKAVESGLNVQKKKLMTTKHCLRFMFNLCPQQGCKTTDKLFLVDALGKKYPLEFNCKNCEMEIFC